jgi:integrase
MTRPRPPHLHREVTRHKKPVWYVRVGKGPRIRIRADYGTSEFAAEYQAAITGVPLGTGVSRLTPSTGTLAWLIERFRETPAWLSLSPATRKKRENIFRQIIESAGRQPYTAITEAHIAAGRDKRGKTPHQARAFIDTMRCLYAWAKEVGFVRIDPAADVKYPTLKSGEGFPIWIDRDVAAYEARWPIGTKERVWFDVLSYTGLRRGDAVRLGKQHVREGEAVITTEKSGGKVEVIIPLHLFPALIGTLRAGPTGDLHFIAGAHGKPMTKDSFGNAFHFACRAAGIKKSAHGLRKLAATRAAEAGANIWQLNAMFGWTGTKMASHYTQAFERRRAAREGFKRLVTNETDSIKPRERRK